jgi:hypothetical protein
MFGKTIHAAQFLFFSHFGPQTVSLDQSIIACFLFPSHTAPSSISVQVAEVGMLPRPAQQPRNNPDAINLNPTWSRTHYQLQQPITIQPNYPIRPTRANPCFVFLLQLSPPLPVGHRRTNAASGRCFCILWSPPLRHP